MKTLRTERLNTSSENRWVLGSAVGLAMVTALVYFTIGLGFAPDDVKAPPDTLMLLAGIGYVAGGLLLFLQQRRLVIIGAVLNLLVITAFLVSLILGNSEIEIYSVTSKIAQIGLEFVLLWMIARIPHAQ